MCVIYEHILLRVMRTLPPVTPHFNVEKDARLGVQLANISSFRVPQDRSNIDMLGGRGHVVEEVVSELLLQLFFLFNLQYLFRQQ